MHHVYPAFFHVLIVAFRIGQKCMVKELFAFSGLHSPTQAILTVALMPNLSAKDPTKSEVMAESPVCRKERHSVPFGKGHA